MAAIIGGNGICHCIHVKEVQDQANNIAQQVILLQRGPDPIRNAWEPPVGEGQAPSGESHGSGQPGIPIGDNSGAANMSFARISLLFDLREGGGSIAQENRPIFNVKMTQQESQNTTVQKMT